MDEQLLTILKLCLLALLYLFFLRVLRAVWTEVGGPRTVERRARRGAPAGPALASACAPDGSGEAQADAGIAPRWTLETWVEGEALSLSLLCAAGRVEVLTRDEILAQVEPE